MSVVAALLSVLVPLACVGWNIGLPRWTMKSWMERLATSAGVVCAVISLVAATSGAALAFGTVGLLMSASLLALTFFSRLPSVRPVVAVGDAAPDFALSDSEGVTRRLSDYAGHWVVLKFYRGHWCPYCVRDLHDWEKMGGDLDARHTRVIAISPDRTDELRAFRSKTRFKMTLLADSENQVIRQYNLQNRNFTPKRGPIRELVIPTTLLIDDLGIVRWIGQASDFRVQRSAQEIMQQIDAFLPGVACETCVLPGGAEIAAVR